MDVARTQSPQPLSLHQNVALRTGVYAGLGLSLILVVWIFLANRVAIPKEFVRERNLATVALLVAVALVPVVRFLLLPAKLWISSLIAWTVFSITYALLGLAFGGLSNHFTAFQVFVLGAVAYMIVATIAWLGNIVWRTWAADAPRRHHTVS